LIEGERVEADKGYRGEYNKVDLPQDCVSSDRDQVKVKKNVRARHETVNRRLKQWGCLSQTFRHELPKHRPIFRAIVVITQIMLQNGHPLFAVDYKTIDEKL